MYYVYILYSESHKIYYKGFTEYPVNRLQEHNLNLSRYTAGKGPWRMVVVEAFTTKREALIRERALKRCKADYFQWLSRQPSNIASSLLS